MSVRKIQRDSNYPTEGFKGVFKGISDNLDVGVGKKLPDGTFAQKEHHFNIGWQPWQQSNETVYEVQYKGKPGEVRPNCANLHPPSIAIPHSNVPYDKVNHFKSEYTNYKKFNISKTEKKSVNMAAQIILGDDKTDYKTTQLVSQIPRPPQQELKYHPKPSKYDIITNEGVQKPANAFDYWNPHTDKRTKSNNVTQIPQRIRRDIIANRF
ncbi:hypothetical protein pb186bvf_018088 [Paramecium bursaria]